LEAAAHVIARRGYSAGTTNRIAEEAGMSIGSLYQYFPNKDAILVELVKAHVNAGIAIIQRLLTGGPLPDSLEDQLRLFVRATIENHLDEPALHRVLFEEAPRPAELLETLRLAEDRLVGAAQQQIATHAEVTVVDTTTGTRLVVSAIESLVHHYFAAGQPVEISRFEDELVAMLFRYLTAAPSSQGGPPDVGLAATLSRARDARLADHRSAPSS
jgi:AcrR family transcriptional regulator